ncbi:MAG: hypothetical protein IKD00_06470 [Candidatus Methanomethylophilaceae archaeon]|nr:hypothetical protein [Candidatus Methanomethylophilaceae archaeon]
MDRSGRESDCPYCGYRCRNCELRFFFESDDQKEARAALHRGTGFEAPDDSEKRKRIREADPQSTLMHRYEQCTDMEERMTVLANGLTEIHGMFTMDHVREFAGSKAEKMVAAMLDQCIVREVRHGLYRV